MDNQNKTRLRRLLQGPLVYLLLLAVIVFVVQSLGGDSPVNPVTLSYSTLLEWVESDLLVDSNKGGDPSKTIDSVIIQQTKLYGRVEGSAIGDSSFGKYYDFESILPSEDQFYKDVSAIYKKVLGEEPSPTEYAFSITSKEPETASWFVQFLPYLISFVVFGLLIFFMMRQQTGSGKGGAMNFGKARARMSDPSKNKVTFDDVAGAAEEKVELREIVDYLRDPQKFVKLGAKIPTGVLLVGPPGTGKTLLARAVAGEAKVPFFTISGSDFVELFVGVGASRVRDLFDQAKKAAPAIIFIDEIDAVGRQRGTGLGGSHDEREQTLNQLLVEMDGFTQNQGIIVLAATNRADVLDPALLRPGRFDRRITVSYPDVRGREEILRVHSRNKPLASDVDLNRVARQTPYFTGADLMNVMNESALLAARTDKTEITMQMIEESIVRVMAGPEKKSMRITELDRKQTAYHECGHAIVSYYIPECDAVREVTTIPRGEAAGYTLYIPQDERHHMSRTDMLARMASCMGGRAAEEIAFGDRFTGPSNDIKQATQLARGMVTEYGMSDELGPVYLGSEREVFLGKSFAQEGMGLSEKTASMIDNEVHRLVEGAYKRAFDILTEHRDQLDALAQLLAEREKLNGEGFKAFMEGKSLPEAADETASN